MSKSRNVYVQRNIEVGGGRLYYLALACLIPIAYAKGYLTAPILLYFCLPASVVVCIVCYFRACAKDEEAWPFLLYAAVVFAAFLFFINAYKNDKGGPPDDQWGQVYEQTDKLRQERDALTWPR